MSGNIRWLPAIVTAGAAAMVLAWNGCAAGGKAADPPADSSPNPPAAAGPTYTVAGFALCEALDVKLLKKQSLQGAPGEEKREGDSVSCWIEMRSPDAEKFTKLYAKAFTLSPDSSPAEALSVIRDEKHSRMDFDGDIDGIGDEAFSKTDDSYDYFQKMIGARQGNLIIEVVLRADGDTEIPAAALESTLTASAKGILASAPRQ